MKAINETILIILAIMLGIYIIDAFRTPEVEIVEVENPKIAARLSHCLAKVEAYEKAFEYKVVMEQLGLWKKEVNEYGKGNSNSEVQSNPNRQEEDR